MAIKNYGNTKRQPSAKALRSAPETLFTCSAILIDMSGHGEKMG
jgi:hypothetical protein